MGMIFIGILIIVAGLYVISLYNNLQIGQTRIAASIQEIGNQLKRQADLIPNLVETTKGYLKHEKSIFDELTEARKTIMSSIGDQAKMDKASETISKMIPQLTAVVESNPQLKGDGVISKLMDELRDTSDKLMYSRRSLIDLTQDFNAKLVTFPSNLIASSFGFKPQAGLTVPTSGAHLEVSEEETKNVSVKL
jgi:LemA protein